ncbi:MAG: hypothetical protein KAX09_04060 [Candidatus Heimdallarchaeota archaeon]|nr:hypothetical protein [Candidatus Heimdallarchaeota archaeon]MCK4290136.1 hypothetical protein [Candidatus Heimdallarchaeota archaeon]
MKKSQITGLVILSTFILIQVSLPAICFENNYPELPSFVNSFPANSKELILNSNGDNIMYHNMEVKIQLDFSLHVASTLVIENSENVTIDYFQYVINDSISNAFVSDPIGSLEFSWNIFEDSSVLNITMRYPLLEGQKYVITIAYFLADLQPFFVEEPSEFYTLEYAIFHYLITQKFDLEISLPLGYGLITSVSPRPTYPIPERVFIEENIVKISWTSMTILPNYEYLYTIRFEEIGVTFSIPTPKSYSYIYIILAFLGGAAISTLVFFLIIKRKYHPEKSELVSSLLSDSEQAVIKAINDEGGVAIQRRICERTSFSKSKVSQILLKLEEKNVLKRERWGRTNKVTITNPSFFNIVLEESNATTKKEASSDD